MQKCEHLEYCINELTAGYCIQCIHYPKDPRTKNNLLFLKNGVAQFVKEEQ